MKTEHYRNVDNNYISVVFYLKMLVYYLLSLIYFNILIICTSHIKPEGSIGVAVFILIPGYLTCEYRYVVITCICLCTFSEAIGITGGHLPNIIDIAPRFSSLIFAVSNTIATIPGIVAPIAVGEITKSGTSEEWKIVFYIASVVAVFAAIMYGLFGNSELAPWARGVENEIEIEVKLTKDDLANGIDVEKVD